MKSFKTGWNESAQVLESPWKPYGWMNARGLGNVELDSGAAFRGWGRWRWDDQDDNNGSSGGCGSGGDDTIVGGGPDDSIGSGDDSMGSGDDDTINSGGDDSTGSGGDDSMGSGVDDTIDSGDDDHGGVDHDGVGGSGGTFLATIGADSIMGNDDDNVLIDAGGRSQTGTDSFDGGGGEDVIYSHWGSDVLSGGDGHDHLISRSDAGEPEIAQDSTVPKYYENENLTDNADALTGGSDNDQFFFRVDLNATAEIIAKHTNDAGEIDWHGVTGENGAPHLHWLDGIGNDTITDHSEAEGDSIVIEGHTVDLTFSYEDLNGDGQDESILHLFSNQGGAGAHDGDQLGTITVYGDMVDEGDVSVDAMVTHGAFATIDEIPLV